MTPLWAVGLMTGTAVDGMIDLALLRSDGETVAEFGPHALLPYPPALPALLREALAAARAWNFTGPEPAIFARAEAALTRAQAGAVRRFVAAQGMAMAQIGVVGFHGQTVLHRPATAARRGATRQLGNGALMARLLGCRVAWDFRSADVAAGGQGAPLAPVYHRALLRQAGAAALRPADLAVLNLGGVGNLTWWSGPAADTPPAPPAGTARPARRIAPAAPQPPAPPPPGAAAPAAPPPPETLIAFDTGPANAPLNDWIAAHGGGEMDRDGALARAGRVDEDRLARLLSDPWLALPPPKSLDRNAFASAMAQGLTLEDGAATLTAFAAAAVGRALDLLPHRPRRLLVCGGGRRNPALMEALARRAAVEALPCEALGWSGDAIEAQCFAYLALRSLRGLPLSYPGTTGVARPLPGGRIAG